jgi:phosphohistidine phosphatase
MLVPVLVFLVRHAHADPGDPDELRPLSTRGREEARSVAERLASHATPPRLVLSSPLRRARETAAAIAAETGAALELDERLAPGATADDLREAVAGRTGPVAAVGHQPDCSEIAAALTGSDPGFPPGGMTELQLES